MRAPSGAGRHAGDLADRALQRLPRHPARDQHRDRDGRADRVAWRRLLPGAASGAVGAQCPRAACRYDGHRDRPWSVARHAGTHAGARMEPPSMAFPRARGVGSEHGLPIDRRLQGPAREASLAGARSVGETGSASVGRNGQRACMGRALAEASRGAGRSTPAGMERLSIWLGGRSGHAGIAANPHARLRRERSPTRSTA